MHCGSCEILIEKWLLKQPGIQFVDASVSSGTIHIQYEKELPRLKKLNQKFKEDGYTFSDVPIKAEKEPLIYVDEKRGWVLNEVRTKPMKKTLFRFVLVFFIMYMIEKSGIAQYVSVSETSSLGVFLVFGIVAGLSSCAALVGGVLLSLTKEWNQQFAYKASNKEKLVPHKYFHGGRLLAYLVFGGVLGAFGSVLSFDNVTVYAAVIMLVSIVMTIIGLQMMGVRWAERIQIRMPKRLSSKVTSQKGTKKRIPFGIGAGTVLLPCGFTLIAQGVALTTGSVLRGALVLFAFALGTMIPLLFISFFGVNGTKSPKRARTFSAYAGIVLVIFGFYNINSQFNLLGWTSLTDLFASSSQATTTQMVPVGQQGEQVISIRAQGFSYIPTGPTTITAGIPTKLVVDDRGVQGCGIFLAARGLMNGFVSLQLGLNEIDLGRPKPGKYKITCSMGMVKPVIITVK